MMGCDPSECESLAILPVVVFPVNSTIFLTFSSQPLAWCWASLEFFNEACAECSPRQALRDGRQSSPALLFLMPM